MNKRSQLLTENILKGSEIWSSRVYTTFLQIPAEILNSNSKIVCLVLQCLAKMTYLNSNQLLDFNNEAMSKFTGIPPGTINRVLTNLQSQVTAANKWLIDNNFSERIEVVKLKQFGTATIYNYQHTPPVIKETFNAAIQEAPAKNTTPAPRKKSNENYIDLPLKQKALLKTGLDVADLEQFYKHDIEKINRNVKYFIDHYANKDLNNPLAMFKKTINKDYGSTYLTESQKAIEYLKEIQAAIDIITPKLTTKILEDIKKAYKFDPPADPEMFANKSAVQAHCKYKMQNLPIETCTRLLRTAEIYADYIKHAPGFIGRTQESILKTAQFAALQILHNAIDFSKIINYKIAA